MMALKSPQGHLFTFQPKILVKSMANFFSFSSKMAALEKKAFKFRETAFPLIFLISLTLHFPLGVERDWNFQAQGHLLSLRVFKNILLGL